MSIATWFWDWLPDNCEVDDCARGGVRGNENRVTVWDDIPMFYILMCDDCHFRYMEGQVLKLDRITSRLVVSASSPVVDFQKRRRERAINKIRKG